MGAGQAVFEQLVWHGWRWGVPELGTSLHDLQYESGPVPGSVAFFDGHVASVSMREVVPAVYRVGLAYGALDLTPMGVRGRDILR